MPRGIELALQRERLMEKRWFGTTLLDLEMLKPISECEPQEFAVCK
jgi:hypothetical protein